MTRSERAIYVGSAVFVALIVGGVGATAEYIAGLPAQVGGISILDCASGVRTGKMTVDLPDGSTLSLAGERGGIWTLFDPPLDITSEGHGRIDADGDGQPIKLDGDITVQRGVADVPPGHTIVFQSGDINYSDRTMPAANGASEETITATCTS